MLQPSPVGGFDRDMWPTALTRAECLTGTAPQAKIDARFFAVITEKFREYGRRYGVGFVVDKGLLE